MQTNFHKLFKPSYEAIAAQGPSPFAKELTELFQSVIDYKNKLIAAGDTKDLIPKVIRFHQTNVPKRYSAIVYKHTGLKVSKFVSSPSPDGGFACCIKTGEGIRGAVIRELSISGYSGEAVVFDSASTVDDTIRALNELTSLYDTNADKLTHNTFALGKTSFDIFCHIYFCPFVAYMNKEAVSILNQSLTAEEVTAVQLHEIGHTLTTIEHAADILRRHTRVLEKIAIKVDTSSSVEDTMHYLEMLNNSVRTATSKHKSGEIDKAIEAADVIMELPKQSSLGGRCTAVILTLAGCAADILWNAHRIILKRLWIMFMADSYKLKDLHAGYKEKRSDLLKVAGDKALCERYADEYVARHGYARHQISGLQKLYASVYNEIPISEMIESTMVHRVYKAFTTIRQLLTAWDETGYGTYEPELKRAESMQVDVLKTMKLRVPASLADFFIEDFEATREAYKKAVSDREAMSKLVHINTVVTYCASVPHLTKLLLTGNIDSNYQKLMDAIKHLNSSELYYHAAKLDQLARK
jgi:hypothetical protein